VQENCDGLGNSEYEYYALCSDERPADCYFGNDDFSNLRWYQGRLPSEIAEEAGFATCFEYMGGYTAENPVPDCCETAPLSIASVKYSTGTELKKLISWFPLINKEDCASCKSLEDKMNAWGPDVCEEKKEYILKKLWAAAKRRNLPFSKRLVTILVDQAIRNSR
jgi:hypothetical protein